MIPEAERKLTLTWTEHTRVSRKEGQGSTRAFGAVRVHVEGLESMTL